MPSFAEYAGKDVVIVGGGDSAFDWALALEPVAASVTLVHRRDAVPCPPGHGRQGAWPSERQVHDQLQRHPADGRARARGRRGRGRQDQGRRRCPRPRPWWRPSGFVADLGPIQQWGLEVDKRHIVVDSTTRTNLPRVFAAGDITDYPGKVRLIAVGFGEAATAVNNAAVAINPDAHLFPGHSSEG